MYNRRNLLWIVVPIFLLLLLSLYRSYCMEKAVNSLREIKPTSIAFVFRAGSEEDVIFKLSEHTDLVDSFANHSSNGGVYYFLVGDCELKLKSNDQISYYRVGKNTKGQLVLHPALGVSSNSWKESQIVIKANHNAIKSIPGSCRAQTLQ